MPDQSANIKSWERAVFLITQLKLSVMADVDISDRDQCDLSQHVEKICDSGIRAVQVCVHIHASCLTNYRVAAYPFGGQ
jgi:hypothetical protein